MDGQRDRTMQFLLGLCLAVLFASSQQQELELCQARNQSEILLSFASSITGSRNWPTSWNITLVNGAIVGLNLSGMNLTGHLSSAWSELPSLEYLDLSYNNFSGPLNLSSTSCSSVKHLNLSNNMLDGPIPPEISKLVKLQVLDLSGNMLAFAIPDSLMQLSSLAILNLSSNCLTGSIPETVEQLRNLTELALASNQLTGSIPETVGQLRNLKQLALSSNQLTGSIPASLANCSSLLHLDLTSNNLTGEVPEDLGKLPLKTFSAGTNNLSTLVVGPGAFQQLENLFLPNNKLKGPVPSGIGSLKMLKKVYLNSNSFTGQIPPELGNLSLLKELWLNVNDLSGTIPEELFYATNLTYLSLGSNELSGQIPPTISKLTGLTNFYVELNSLSGQLPDFSGLQNLLVISMSGNNFSGQIPPSYGNLTKLIGIDVGNNSLRGELPDYSQLGKLEYLFLGNNRFSGRIPDWVGQLPRLKALDLSYNRFGGPLPSNYSGMSVLKTRQRYNDTDPSTRVSTDDGKSYNNGNTFPTTIDFSFNQLSGSIPEQFGLLRNLQSLILSNNNLTGNIPSQLGNAASMIKLVLSHNQLNGSIPTSLINLSFLAEFNVADNHLSGPIPTAAQFNTFPNTSYLGNDGLCGPPLEPCWSAPSPVSPRGQEQKMIILPVVVGICGVVFLSGLLAVYLAVVRKRHKLFISNSEGCEIMEFHSSGSGAGGFSFSMAFSDKLPEKISAKQLAAATNNYSHANIVGDGGFGIVYKAVLDSGDVVAVKKLSSGGVQGDREFQAELQTLGDVRHPNLVPLLGYCLEGRERLLIYKYLSNGSLDTWLYCREPGTQPLDWPTRLRIARGAAAGVAYLHHGGGDHPPIIHRDIKVSNILLDDRFEAHVADFGLARHVDAGATHVSTDVAGTIGYIPPEYNHKCVATTKGDVYSFGVVCLEMLTGKRPTDQFFRLQQRRGGGGDGAGPAPPPPAQHLVAWVRGMRTLEEHRAALDATMMGGDNGASWPDMLEMMRIACMCCRDVPSKRPTMQEVADMLERLEQRAVAAAGVPVVAVAGSGQRHLAVPKDTAPAI